jgi:hypothetical protein
LTSADPSSKQPPVGEGVADFYPRVCNPQGGGSGRAGPAGWSKKCDTVSGSGDNNAAIRGSEKDELMKRAILGASAAAAIALAPLCIPPAHADPIDPCVSITDPAAHQACIGDFVKRREKAQCDASPHQGQLGQLCG